MTEMLAPTVSNIRRTKILGEKLQRVRLTSRPKTVCARIPQILCAKSQLAMMGLFAICRLRLTLTT